MRPGLASGRRRGGFRRRSIAIQPPYVGLPADRSDYVGLHSVKRLFSQVDDACGMARLRTHRSCTHQHRKLLLAMSRIRLTHRAIGTRRSRVNALRFPGLQGDGQGLRRKVSEASLRGHAPSAATARHHAMGFAGSGLAEAVGHRCFDLRRFAERARAKRIGSASSRLAGRAMRNSPSLVTALIVTRHVSSVQSRLGSPGRWWKPWRVQSSGDVGVRPFPGAGRECRRRMHRTHGRAWRRAASISVAAATATGRMIVSGICLQPAAYHAANP